MAKFYGKIGFIETTETRPGVWTPEIVERDYYGDVLRNNSRWDTASKTNDDLNINNQISIIADPYAQEHFHAIKYIEFMGTLWKIHSVEVAYPRLILNVGGVYNETQTGSA